MSAPETLLSFAGAIREAFRPLEFALDDAQSLNILLMEHGWEPPEGDAHLDIIRSRFELTKHIEKLASQLDDQVGTSNLSVDAAANTLEVAVNLFSRVLNSTTDNSAPSPLNNAEFWATFPRDLANTLASDYLRLRYPALYGLFLVSGVIWVRKVPGDRARGRLTYDQVQFHWDRLVRVLSEPRELAAELYGWGEQLEHDTLLERLQFALYALGVPVSLSLAHHELLGNYYAESNPALNELRELRIPLLIDEEFDGSHIEMGFALLPIPANNELAGAPSGFLFGPYAEGEFEEEIPVGGLFEFRMWGGLAANSAIGLEVQPESIRPSWMMGKAPTTELDAGVALEATPLQPWTLFGREDSTHVAVKDFRLALAVMGSVENPELELTAGTSNAALVLALDDADGFLKHLFGRVGNEDPPEPSGSRGINLTLGISSTRGFFVRGGHALRVSVPINERIGPLSLDTITFALDPTEDELNLTLSLTGSAKIGPVTAIVQDLGLRASFNLNESDGFPVPMPDFGFKPPTGIGLSIDSQGIKGGGFLSLESPNYFGVLELSFQDEIDLTAFGLITTQLPDGKDGFSLVISILAEFQPIQLGLGFALTGVGGLIGINRQMNEEALRETVKSHSLDHILFPAAPIKDAVKIIDSIKNILPPKEGFHVFGPMAQVIWGGSVTLVEFQVGIFIEIGGPVRIALIGQASARLPNKKAPVVVLNMDLLGYIDFGKETVAIDSSLFDSHIQGIKIDGQMALRSSWGDNADFAMSVGGFFPRYTPPPGFPTLKRLAVTLGDGNPKISLSAYMAITSNTLQFGALLDLHAQKAGFTIVGGMGFDALFIFNPFSFEVEIKAWVDVRRGQTTLMAVSLGLTLTGPNPFRAKGYAKIRICWFLKFKVRFDVTFGEKKQQIQATVSPLTVLRGELEDPRNIRFELPHWASAALMFAEGADQRLDRSGSWVFSQNAVPLNFPMARFGGTTPPAGEQQLSIAAAVPGDTDAIPSEATAARFAPEQFHDWSVEDKLAAPAFEEFESGLRLGGSFKSGPPSAHKRISVEFETILRESDGYLSSLNESNPKNVLQRYLGLASATAKARSQATARSQPMYTPRRNSRDTQHPNFVSVAGTGR